MAFRVTPARAAARSWAMTAGQLALALAGVASCVALVCIIVGMLRWIIRVAKFLQIMDRPVDRPTVGGRAEVATDDPKYAKVDAQVMVKFRLLVPILESSREARDAVRLALDLIEGLPSGVAVLRKELHERRGP